MITAPSAVITGGSRGIGFGIAEMLVRRGWAVTLTARRADHLDRAVDALVSAGGRAQGVAGDMADDATTARVLARHTEAYDGLSGLVLAAGVGSGGDIAGYPMTRFDKQFAVNIRAPYALVSQALPLLRRSAPTAPAGRARVVAISSLEGVHPEPGLAAYGASKAALISLVRSINSEENSHGVLATAVSPGFVDTELSRWTTDTIPSDQMISVDDVVKVVELVFSLSANASLPHIVLNRLGGGAYHA